MEVLELSSRENQNMLDVTSMIEMMALESRRELLLIMEVHKPLHQTEIYVYFDLIVSFSIRFSITSAFSHGCDYAATTYSFLIFLSRKKSALLVSWTLRKSDNFPRFQVT